MSSLHRCVAVITSFAITLALTFGVALADGTPMPSCAVTQANDVPQPRLENAPIPGKTFSQNDIWVSVGPPTNPFVLYASQELGPEAGSQAGLRANKMLWLRGESVVGELVVTATRLDGHSPDATEYPPKGSSAYGDRGFAVVSLAFADPGCWEITATAGTATLSMIAEIMFLENMESSPVASPSN